jgi:hypothetical protein
MMTDDDKEEDEPEEEGEEDAEEGDVVNLGITQRVSMR